LLVVLSVMNGFDRELRTRILSMVPHVLVHAAHPLQDWEPLATALEQDPAVVGVAPFIGGTAMLSTPGVVRGVELTGIRPERDARVSPIGRYMVQGDLAQLRPGAFGVVIGNLLARSLGVQPGDHVTLMLPELSVTPAGAYPRMRRFRVVGIFAVGAQVDATTALIHLDDAARLYRTGGGVQGVRLALADPDLAPVVRERIASALAAGLVAEDWSVSQGSLFSAIRMEKRMVTLLLLVIVAVAAFNIVSILTMVVAEKRGAIAVLRTMGASPRQVMAIFTVQGSLIGLAGLAMGLVGRHSARLAHRQRRGLDRAGAGLAAVQPQRLLHQLHPVAGAARRYRADRRLRARARGAGDAVSGAARLAYRSCGGLAL
jgi:lipoprotein-releasing system permease protein